MKKLLMVLSAGLLVTVYSACSDSKERYVDISTGQPVELEKDEATGVMVNSTTKQPVYMYIDTKNNDTIYGKTGKVINGHVVKTSDNRYLLDEDEKLEISNNSVEYKEDNYKVEVEKDGDIKIKNGDTKTKIDGETGERKTKND